MSKMTSDEVVRLWLSGLRADNTLRAYSYDLRLARKLLGPCGLDSLDRQVVGTVLRRMKTGGYSNSSIRRMHCTLRVLAAELAAYEVISPADYFGIRRMKMSPPRVDRAGRYIERPERARLFAAIDKTARNDKEQALLGAVLALGLGGGLRYEEVRNLKPEDYDPAEGQVRVKHAKGGKERYVYLAGEAKKRMDAVLGKGVKFSSFSFDLWDSLRFHARLPDIVFHDLRRTFASDAWDAGIDASTVAAMLGHSHVQTSMMYDRRGDERKKRAAKVMMGKK